MPIPDFPPPSFQEAIKTAVYRMQEIPMSDTSFSSYHSIQRSPSVDSYPTTSASSPTSQYEDAYDVDAADITHSLPRFSTSDVGSPVEYPPAEWEVERQQGIPLEERVRRERERREQAETTQPGVTPSESASPSRTRSCSHCGAASKSPTEDRRPQPAETVPRRRGILRHRQSQTLSSASVPSTPIRSRPHTSLKSTSSSKRKSRSMSPRPSLMAPMTTSNSLSLMSRKIFAHSHKGKDRSAEDEPLESWEVLDTGPLSVPEVEIPQPPVSRVRRTLSRMSLSALAAINTQTESGRNGSIEPYPFDPPLPSAATEKSRLKQSDPPATTHNMPSSFQRDYPSTTSSTPPPVRASSPLMTRSFPPPDVPPTSFVNIAASTPDLSPTRPTGLVDSRQVQTSPLISPLAIRLGARQRVRSMSVHTGPPSSIVFPKVQIPTDRRTTPNSKLRKHTSTAIDPSSPLSVLNAFPDVPPIKTQFEKPTQNRGFHVSSLSTVRPPPSPLVSPLEPPTPIKHHYPGRPLPTPPAGVPPSPSAYESLLPRSATATRFGLTLNVSNGMNGTMMTERSTATSSGLTYLTDRPTSPLSTMSGSSIIEAINEADDDTLGSEATDLDLLISRIESNDLPVVSEMIGEAERPGTARPHDRPEDSAGTPLVGRVEVQRRRKLKDGRVKLKLRLMGASVNSCGICLMQFKEKEMGALTPKCQHPWVYLLCPKET